MVELEDKSYISGEIELFEKNLPKEQNTKGFCQLTREKSLKLKNTQGYRDLILKKHIEDKAKQT